jgi:hypothetical protein
VNDRKRLIFDAKLMMWFSLNDLVIAVRRGDKWAFYDPGETFLPAATLNWNNSDTYALISDPKKSELHFVPGASAEESIQQRNGEFTLTPDGTLEGKVTITYTGLRQVARKLQFDDDTPEERVTSVKHEIEANLKLAEVTNVVIENAVDPSAPLKITFDLRVPEFAERTGSRLFLQPAVFQKGAKPLFADSVRRANILMDYRYSEKDRVSIRPPEGYTIEAGSAPASMDFGAAAEYKVGLGVGKKTGAVIYTRALSMKQVAISKDAYPALKRLFDLINEQDNHVLTLKRAEAVTAAQSPGAPASQPAPPKPEASSAPPATATGTQSASTPASS